LVSGFARFTAAVVEGGLCGDWLMTTVRRAALDMELAQLSVSVASRS